MLILSIITIALGALIIANPTQTAAVAVSLCGVGLLISESLNTIECVYIIKIKFKDGLYLPSFFTFTTKLAEFVLYLKHIQQFLLYIQDQKQLNVA